MGLFLLKTRRFFHLIDKTSYKKEKKIELVRQSKYFDADWYLQINQVKLRKNMSAAEHYLNIGWKKGYNPSLIFNTKEYLKNNPDVKAAHINPLLHYELRGKKERRYTQPPRFDLLHFKKKYKLSAQQKRMLKSDFFDETYYLTTYPDAAKSSLPAIIHYDQIGWKKGYNPSSVFDTQCYLELYQDIKKANINPLVHFCFFGKSEGRIAMPVNGIPQIYQGNIDSKKENILLVSHILNHTGAPILLYQVGLLLMSKGYNVFMMSPDIGDLKSEIMNSGMTLIIAPKAYLFEKYTFFIKKYHFKYAICNTIITGRIYGFLRKFIPSLWWVHDNLQSRDTEFFKNILAQAQEIYVPSLRTKQCLSLYNKHIKMLSYPIQCMVPHIKSKTKCKSIKIAVFATINERKGQDIFIDAINLLPKSIRQKGQFLIIGENSSKEFSQSLKQKTKNTKEIIWKDCIKNVKEYHECMDEIDVLCCPSREDPFPLVVIDAMMHGNPVIISDHVGQTDIITNGQDGFIFPSGDAFSLAKILEYLIQQGISTVLRQKSRALFENRFSPDKWFEQFNKIMEDICKKSS